jgi:hypothetical protein
MSRDPLAEATRALREDADASPARPDETRARVLATLRKERARRIPLLRVVLPLAAVLVGSMAWAAAGGHLPAAFQAVFPASITSPEVAPPHREIPSSAPPIALVAPPEPAEKPLDFKAISPELSPKAPDAPRAEEPGPAAIIAPPPVVARPADTSTPQLRPARKDTSSVVTPPQAASTAVAVAEAVIPAEPDEQALYAAAHRLHFAEHNPAAALAAWDGYLRAAPRGRFSVEAHYNRALCLVRLGRAAEAEASLQSFARGAYGGYRKEEARALLDALHGATP